MKNTIVRLAGIVCLGLAAVVVVTVMAVRVAASPSVVLDACINPGNGMMRLVNASTACHNDESRVEWNVEGPQGPAGPQGPQGPQGPAGSSAGGPPFTWVCTPASFPNTAGNPRADIYVFNGSTVTANVSVNILDANGNNLAGAIIPGSNPPVTYPGQTGSDSVTVAPGATLNNHWLTPQTGPASQGFDGVTNVSVSVRVVSDQPTVVGSDMPFGNFQPTPCSLLPK